MVTHSNCATEGFIHGTPTLADHLAAAESGTQPVADHLTAAKHAHANTSVHAAADAGRYSASTWRDYPAPVAIAGHNSAANDPAATITVGCSAAVPYSHTDTADQSATCADSLTVADYRAAARAATIAATIPNSDAATESGTQPVADIQPSTGWATSDDTAYYAATADQSIN